MESLNVKKMQNTVYVNGVRKRARLLPRNFKDEYTRPNGIKRVRRLHPTKGWRDERA